MLILAIISMNLALLFYSVGVWSEKRQGTLKPWHIIVFFTGLIFDTLGTTSMEKIAGGSFKANFHGITGLLALLLMLFHALWATWVIKKGTDKSKKISINSVLLFGLFGLSLLSVGLSLVWQNKIKSNFYVFPLIYAINQNSFLFSH